MQYVEHIGIAVKDLEKSNALFAKLLNILPYKMETVESEKVRTSFFRNGETKIELLESMDEDGPIGKYISKRGEGLHHIAFEVEDIRAEMKRLESEGFQLINQEPKRGADHKLVCFIHPKTANGVLIELCQAIREEGTQESE